MIFTERTGCFIICDVQKTNKIKIETRAYNKNYQAKLSKKADPSVFESYEDLIRNTIDIIA